MYDHSSSGDIWTFSIAFIAMDKSWWLRSVRISSESVQNDVIVLKDMYYCFSCIICIVWWCLNPVKFREFKYSTERTKVMIKLYAIIHIYVNDYETRRAQTSVLMIVVKWPEVKPRSTHSSYQYWFHTSDEVNTSIMIMIHISYHRIFLYRFDMITYS